MRILCGIIILFWVPTAWAETAWEKYLAKPTPEQAERVNKIEYADPGNKHDGLQILQNQVLAQDSQAFRLAYRLYQSPDAAESEELGALLARTIRVHPQFFLRQIMSLNIPCSKVAWILNTPGLEYVDRPNARHYEIEMRKKALSSIEASGLSEVRDQCLKEFHND
jgi:hypothetical protein